MLSVYCGFETLTLALAPTSNTYVFVKGCLFSVVWEILLFACLAVSCLSFVPDCGDHAITRLRITAVKLQRRGEPHLH
jgi:hypothetical protein